MTERMPQEGKSCIIGAKPLPEYAVGAFLYPPYTRAVPEPYPRRIRAVPALPV